MSAIPAVSTLSPLLDLSSSGPLESVYQYLTPGEARKFSITCRVARRAFTNEEVQKALLNIHFPAMANGLPFSSRGLFLRASIGKHHHTEAIQTLSGHTKAVHSLQMSADGTRALSASSDNTFKLWDLTSGECLWSLGVGFVNCFQISADGTRILAGFFNTLGLWDLTGKCLHTFWHEHTVTCLQMSADGTRALSGSADKTLKLWDLTTGTCLHTLSDHREWIMCLQISADGAKAFSGSTDKTLKLWDLKSGICLHTFTEHEDWINCLQMSADGTKGLSGSMDKTLKLWDLSEGTCLQTLRGHEDRITCLQMSADGTKALSGSWDKTLKFWDLIRGTCLWTLLGHTESISGLQMSADGTKALSGSSDRTLKLWDLTTGICLQTLSGHENSVTCLQMNRDGSKAVSGSSDSTLKLWNLIPSLASERVARVAHAFCENRKEADRLFSKLPRFVRNPIAKALYELHVHLGKISPNQTDQHYGQKALLKKGGFSSLAEERNKVFTDYMKRQFLSDVAEYLEELRQNNSLRVAYAQCALFKDALECLDQLPISIKLDVYKELYEIKKAANTLPERAPSNCGRLAFYEQENYTATIQERIQAIKNVMARTR